MECLVTGCAGFIGSHLCETLLKKGHRVHGIDCFTSYYSKESKEKNLSPLQSHPRFQFYPLNLAEENSQTELNHLMRGIEWIYHLAAAPGLIASWDNFSIYNTNNVLATHRLLETAKNAPMLNRLVYASTSSVYGKYASGDEALPLKPSSPYGVTKLAAENLCRVYYEAFDLPVVILRYFSVYGPRQRPDMGYYKFIQSISQNEPVYLTGDGFQIRGNTFVSDCVNASIAAMDTQPGSIFNVGGGELITVREVIRKIEQILGKRARITQLAERPGDQKYTGADTLKLCRATGWKPLVKLEEGLSQQIEWQIGKSLRQVA